MSATGRRRILLRHNPFTPVYTTWNPSDKSAAVTLSGGNLTAALTNGGAGGMVRAVAGKSTGKWYYECKVDAFATWNCLMGWAAASAPLANFPGIDANGWGFYGTDGSKYNNAVGAAYGSAWVVNDIIGCYIDLDSATKTIGFLVNNVDQGIAHSNLSGTLYPALGNPGAGTQTMTARFNPASFTYSPPSGYAPVWN